MAIDSGYGVRLVAVDSEHMELLRGWRNDPKVWGWCRRNDMICDADQRDWFDRQRKDPSIHMYLIKNDGGIVGVCGFTSHDKTNRSAELSMYIDPKEHGRGYASAAFKTLMEHGFKYFGLHTAWAECFDGNAVIGLLEKLGLKKDGIKREAYFREGRFINAELLSITETEWKSLYLPS